MVEYKVYFINQDDEDIIEDAARVCKHTMRRLNHLFTPFLMEFLNFITQ